MKDKRLQFLVDFVKQLDEEVAENSEKFEAAEKEKFSKLSKSVLDLSSKYNSIDEKQTLAQNDAKDLYDAYSNTIDDIYECAEMFIGEGSESVIFSENEAELYSSMDALQNTQKLLKKQVEQEKPTMSLENVVTDISYIKEQFKPDPQTKSLKGNAEVDWDLSKHTVKESLDKYIEGINKMNKGFQTHMENILGEKGPYETLLYAKLQTLQRALNDEFPSGESKLDVTLFTESHRIVREALDRTEMVSLTRNTAINDHFFDAILSELLNEDQFQDAINVSVENGQISREHADIYIEQIHNLRFAPHNLGMDPESIAYCDQISNLILITTLAEDKFREKNYTEEKFNDVNDPLYSVVQSGRVITSKILNYVKGEPGAEAPSVEDYTLYFDCLEAYVDSQPIIVGNGVFAEKNKLLQDCLSCCYSVSAVMPNEFTQRYEALSNRVNLRFKENVNEYLQIISEDTLTQVPGEPEGVTRLSQAWENLTQQYMMGKVTEEEYQKAYFIRMCRDTGYRESQLKLAEEGLKTLQTEPDKVPGMNRNRNHLDFDIKKADIYRAILIGKLVEHEYDASRAYMNRQDTTPSRKRMENAFNITLGFSVYAKQTPSKQLQEDLQQLIKDFCDSKNFKAYMEASPEELEYLNSLPNDMTGGMLYGKQDDFVKNLSEGTIIALTQESGRTRENSYEYNQISNAMANITSKNHRVGGVQPKDYMELFDATCEYLKGCDTKLSGENGQKRIDATRDVLSSLCEKLLNELPEKREVIEKEMHLNMLRSKEFRNKVMENASETLKLYSDGDGVIDKMAYQKLDPADKLKVDNALKTYAYGIKAEELLNKIGAQERIKGKIKNEAVEDKLLDKFKAAQEYSEKALTTKYNEVMIAHGKQIESQNQTIKDQRIAGEEDKEIRANYLNDLIDETKAQLKQSGLEKKDDEVIETASLLTYLNTVKDNIDLLSPEKLKSALSQKSIEENTEKLKPFVAKIANEMPTSTYNRLVDNGGIAEKIQGNMKMMLKNSDKIAKEYQDNVAKNDGKFKRNEDAVMMSMK